MQKASEYLAQNDEVSLGEREVRGAQDSYSEISSVPEQQAGSEGGGGGGEDKSGRMTGVRWQTRSECGGSWGHFHNIIGSGNGEMCSPLGSPSDAATAPALGTSAQTATPHDYAWNSIMQPP